MARRSYSRRIFWVLLILAAAYAARRLPTRLPETLPGAAEPGRGERAIVEAFEERRSDLWVESEATVERLLADDREGVPHQRFIVRLAGGQTLLLVHNLDLAARVPVAAGDRVAFRGEYEWNERGGLVHWTHHDPGGRHQGGWIRHRDETYR